MLRPVNASLLESKEVKNSNFFGPNCSTDDSRPFIAILYQPALFDDITIEMALIEGDSIQLTLLEGSKF